MKKPSILIVFLSVFIDLIGFGIVMPLLPLYSAQFGASGVMVGLIVASFSAMQFIFGPIWGGLSDRIGRKPLILFGNLGAAGAYVLFAIASGMEGTWGLVWIFASRIFAGICGANVTVASAYMADISPPEKRSRNMGLIGMAFGLGFIVGPAMGALTAHFFGPSGPGWSAAALCAFNFGLGCFVLKESRKPESRSASHRPRLSQWKDALGKPVIGSLILLYFVAIFAFSSFESTFSVMLYESEHFQYGSEHIGYLFAYCGFIAAMVQGGAIGRLVKRFGESKIIIVSFGIMAVSMVWLPYSTTLWALLIGAGLLAIGSGINRAPTFGLISIHTSADEQGAMLGVTQSAGSLARILGPIFAMSLYDYSAALPYVLCGVFSLIAGGAAWKVLKSGEKDSNRQTFNKASKHASKT